MPDPDQRTVSIEVASLLCARVASDLGSAETELVQAILAIPDEKDRLRAVNRWIGDVLAASDRARAAQR